MPTELSDRKGFSKNTVISKQIILLLQTEIWLMYTYSGKLTSV